MPIIPNSLTNLSETSMSNRKIVSSLIVCLRETRGLAIGVGLQVTFNSCSGY